MLPGAKIENATMSFLAIGISVIALLVSVGHTFFGLELSSGLWAGIFLCGMAGIGILENSLFKSIELEKVGNIVMIVISLVVFAEGVNLITNFETLVPAVQGFVTGFIFLEAIVVFASLWS